jgi:hypothetical protein
MYVQIMMFEGPRSPELVEASQRAGRERISPLIASHPDLRHRLVGGFRAVGEDGAECVVSLAQDAEAFRDLGELVMSSELLPGENPELLPGPDRIQQFELSDTFGTLADLLARSHHQVLQARLPLGGPVEGTPSTRSPVLRRPTLPRRQDKGGDRFA